MPEYLAPGVFVEETSFRQKSIEGVGTSVAAIVGPTRYGPLRGRPEVVTSFAEFTRIYGDAADLVFEGTAEPNYTAIAARAFFDNGGKQLFVSRICRDVNLIDASGDNADAARARLNSAPLGFAARFPGAAGNFTLELRWRDAANLLRSERIAAPPAGTSALLQVAGIPATARIAGATLDAARFPLRVTAIVSAGTVSTDPNDANAPLVPAWLIQGAAAEITDADGEALTAAEIATLGGALLSAEVPASATFTRVSARAPASGALVAGEQAVLLLSAPSSLAPYLGGVTFGSRRLLRGTLNAAGTTLSLTAARNTVMNGNQADAARSLSADVVLPLAALAARPDVAFTLFTLRAFDLDVLNAGEAVYSVADIAPAAAAARNLAAVLPPTPARQSDRLAQPVAATLTAGASADAVLDALFALADVAALLPAAAALAGSRWLLRLTGGSDGAVPNAADYTGEAGVGSSGATGFVALEDIEDISIVCTPAAAAHPASHAQVVQAMWAHCRRMRYRVGIVDAEAGMSLNEVRSFAGQFSDSLLALYYPWVVTSDPTGARPELTVPPGGFIAGVYAGTDVRRGVHKAPANEVLIGASGLELDVNRFQQELLNPNGINCLRFFPGRGYRVWGARTLSDDPEWRYVNVRRYFLFLERSIEKSTQWAVFEPNGEALWANVRSTIEDFLYSEWVGGHLLGSAPKEAFFVRCDRSTMTQNDLDNGRLVCLIGVAPLRPAEFVIFRIGQKTADAQ